MTSCLARFRNLPIFLQGRRPALGFDLWKVHSAWVVRSHLSFCRPTSKAKCWTILELFKSLTSKVVQGFVHRERYRRSATFWSHAFLSRLIDEGRCLELSQESAWCHCAESQLFVHRGGMLHRVAVHYFSMWRVQQRSSLWTQNRRDFWAGDLLSSLGFAGNARLCLFLPRLSRPRSSYS